MANENSKDPAATQPQSIPLAKIHDLPGAPVFRQPDKSYGGLVTSIQAGGVKEPVILRLREDGEYQLVSGYRRRRASELAKKQDIPALVYEMSLQDALRYHSKVNGTPDMPIPGKLVPPPSQAKKPEIPGIRGPEKPTAGEKPKEAKPGEVPKPPAEQPKAEKEAPAKAAERPPAPAAGEKPKEAKPGEGIKPPAEQPKAEKVAPAKAAEKPPVPSAGEKPKEAKPGEVPKPPAEQPEAEKEVPAKAAEKLLTPAAGEKPKETKPGEVPKPSAEQPKAEKEAPAKAAEKPPAPAAGEKPKEAKPAEGIKPSAEQPKAEKEAPAKAAEKPPVPAAGEKPKEIKPGEVPAAPNVPVPEGKGKDGPSKTEEKLAHGEKPKEGKTTGGPTAPANVPVPGPAAKGPAGTAISQVFEERLAPPDEKALKDLPAPKEGESFFITLHPAYLEKSQFNVFSVDQSSENFKELVKSVELVGIKDPVLARLKPEGGLEILSGQRRHLAASALNYPVPTIIQKIDDADAKIIVADGNLHRDKISSYDLSRALRMKMEGMKQKSGRRKKGEIKTDELYSDEKLAQEMGMKVSKLNRIIRLSEATKDVCDRVDDNSLPLSIASAISFLGPENQDLVLHLSDLGYKLTNERVERMKKVDKGGKLNELTMRDILDDKDLAPKQATPPPAPQQPPSAPPPIPPSPDVPRPPKTPPIPPAPETPHPSETAHTPEGPNISPAPAGPSTPPAPEAPPPGPAAPPSASEAPGKSTFKGEQERPEYTKVILAGDRLRKYFPDVSMTPREIEESVYDALEERSQRQIKAQQKAEIFQKNKGGPTK